MCVTSTSSTCRRKSYGDGGRLLIETADVDGISATLKARGYSLAVDQEPFETFKQLGLHNIYATRR